MQEARKQAGLTQQQVSDALNIPQTSVAALETVAMGSRRLPDLARLYGCNAQWLATGDGSPRPTNGAELDTGNFGPLRRSVRRGRLECEGVVDGKSIRLSLSEFDLVTAFRVLPDEEQTKLLKEITERAVWLDAYVQREWQRRGLTSATVPLQRTKTADEPLVDAASIGRSEPTGVASS
jgi:transcriptional regulator with XRE-family HTH domain